MRTVAGFLLSKRLELRATDSRRLTAADCYTRRAVGPVRHITNWVLYAILTTMPDTGRIPLPATLTHLIFDFFGTLVRYTDSWTAQGFPQTHTLLQTAGARLGYDEFLRRWSETFARFETEARRSLQEYSIAAPAGAFLADVVESPERVLDSFIRTYLTEWNRAVEYLPGLRPLLVRLSHRHILSIITNTHAADVVRDHLLRMGIADLFVQTVTSIEYGRRKPSPEIFGFALRQLGSMPDQALYVGDTYETDYVGAVAVGMPAVLIDADHKTPVPPECRIQSLFALEDRLAMA